MPVCKAEAHRALELLEDYYSRLDEADERELKVAIERVSLKRLRLKFEPNYSSPLVILASYFAII